jgi:hypothetical protein
MKEAEIKIDKIDSKLCRALMTQYVHASDLTTYDTYILIIQFFEWCKGIFFEAQRRRSFGPTLQTVEEAYLSKTLDSLGKEKRRYDIKTIGDGGIRAEYRKLCYEICPLETKEEKGIFFEKRLIIIEDCRLAILSLWYEKVPTNEEVDPEKRNVDEIVKKAELLRPEDDGFRDEVLKVLDKDKKIFHLIVNIALDPISPEVNRMKEALENPEKFLAIKARLGN